MPKRYIQSFNSIFLDPENETAGLATAMANLPKRATRRMSRLGIMLHHLLQDLTLDLQTTLVYGTCFTEITALENYLDSFPYASPIAFQTSIHPGGIEQALILDKREVGAFFPMAGNRNLMIQMVKLGFAAEPADVVLCGGEEKGSWLEDFGLASDCSFAFVLRITDDPKNACGELLWEENARNGEYSMPNMKEAVGLLSRGQAVTFQSASLGLLRILPS